jgi:hypothetical protein
VRIGRWRENLTPAEQRDVNARLGETLRRWGYSVPATPGDPQPSPPASGELARRS